MSSLENRSDNELLELVWRNGHVVFNNQKQSQALPYIFEPEQISNPESLLKCRDSLVNYCNFSKDGNASWFEEPWTNSTDQEFSDCFYGVPTSEPGRTEKHSSFHCQENTTPNSSLDDGSIIKFSNPGTTTDFGIESRNFGEETSSCRTITTKLAKNSHSITNHGHKRKGRNLGEYESHSEEAGYESAEENKRTQRLESVRRCRSSEVHNLSERRRRDRINEKMKELQELLPHCNKLDKASMLDEAIEYLKSLQLQLQFMLLGSGMAPMFFPSIHQLMSNMAGEVNRQLITSIRNPPHEQSLPETCILNQPPDCLLQGQSSDNFAAQLQQYSSCLGFPLMQIPQMMSMRTSGPQMIQTNQIVGAEDNNHMPVIRDPYGNYSKYS